EDGRTVLSDRSGPRSLQRQRPPSFSRHGYIRQLGFTRQHLQPVHQIGDFLKLREVAFFRRVGEDDLTCKFWLKSREGWINVPELVGIIMCESQTLGQRPLKRRNGVGIGFGEFLRHGKSDERKTIVFPCKQVKY